jgi:hypothetical protein
MSNIRVTIAPDSPRFLDQLRLHMRAHGLTYRTEQTYIHRAKRYIYYHGKRHPKVLGAAELGQFLADLSNQHHCSINAQKSALNALVYLYKGQLKDPEGFKFNQSFQ